MLKFLRLQNIILVEQADIPFSSGLNVITGETGAGKSAIMKALSAALGERSDASMIRNGCDKGTVEAIFETEQIPQIAPLLEEAGIDYDQNGDLIIRREISVSGKNRVFINNQLAQLTLLKNVGSFLSHIVGQHSNLLLFSLDYQRRSLDIYGGIDRLANEFKTQFEKESSIRKEINNLLSNESQRLRDIDLYQREIEELEEASLKEGEDEELFSEYSLLTNSKDLYDKVNEINQGLNGERQSILTSLQKYKNSLESISKLDPSLSEVFQSFKNALIEFQEISHTLRRYQGSLHEDPVRLEEINERLSLINKLKRKYGATVQDILTYQQECKQKLTLLQNSDTRIEDLQNDLARTEETTNKLASELTTLRTQAAQQLETELTNQLRSLNMSKALLRIEISPQKRSVHGDDRIEFFLQPNAGEHRVALKEAASGGEVSRVLLALQTLLANKEKIPTLIFDEVDANIGGETATIVGDKLKEIGSWLQVICITHFPQVANKAHHHLKISKQEREGRTFTQVEALNKEGRVQELERMMGGHFALAH